MKLWLAIPTMSQDLVESAVHYASSTWRGLPNIVLHGNGFHINTAPLIENDRAKALYTTHTSTNIGVVGALDQLHRTVRSVGDPDDLICYIHDDVQIMEHGWNHRVLDLFREHPERVLAGFSGAMGLADADIYQKPYELIQLARKEFVSNMRDADAHGARVTEERQVATIDGFSMIVRLSFLNSINGFSWWPFPHHSYDNALACHVARQGKETWLVPVYCHHNGGMTATRSAYLDDLAAKWGGDGEIHRLGHELLYQNFRDVLPLRVFR